MQLYIVIHILYIITRMISSALVRIMLYISSAYLQQTQQTYSMIIDFRLIGLFRRRQKTKAMTKFLTKLPVRSFPYCIDESSIFIHEIFLTANPYMYVILIGLINHPL